MGGLTERTIPPPSLFAIIGLGAFVTALDQTVVVTALPEVMVDLKVPVTELDRASWIVTAYLLGYISAMPLIARIADVYGYPRVYQASLFVFMAGSLLVATASSLEWMVGARVVQAVGRSRNGARWDGIGECRTPLPQTRSGRGHGGSRSGDGLNGGASLRGRHHRGLQLALGLLAQRPPGRPNVAGAHVAPQPTAERGASRLPGWVGPSRGLSAHVAGSIPRGAVHSLVSCPFHLGSAGNRDGRGAGAGRAQGVAAFAGPIPVSLLGVLDRQHHPAP